MGGRRSGQCAVALSILAAGSVAYAGQAPGGYHVKACSLVSLAEIKKLAPWPPNINQQATAEEIALPGRSMCVYPTALQVQVEAYRPQFRDVVRKTLQLAPIAGIGDEAYIGNNQNLTAIIYTKVGPHLLTVEMEIPAGKTFESAKPTVIAVANVFITKLR